MLMAGEGEPILFLHGIPGSAWTWSKVASQLSADHKVLMPDLRGFGGSSMPDGDWYMEGQASSLSSLIDALHLENLTVCAHDFGGPVLITMLRMFPHLKVKTLVVSSTNVFTDTFVPLPLRVASVPGLGSLVFQFMAGSNMGIKTMYLQGTRNKNEASWSDFERHLTRGCLRLTPVIFQRSLADLKGNYSNIESYLPCIEVPTLVLWGDRDPFFGVDVAERTSQAINGSSLQVFKDTGHFVPEERPDEVALAIHKFIMQ